MIKYSDTSNDLGFECPYCGQMTEHDDWSDRGLDIENERMECDSCGKQFFGTVEVSFSFDSTPNCELNGNPHKLTDVIYGLSVCDECGHTILKPKGEK